MRRHLAILAAVTAAVIAAFVGWWWHGQPVQIVDAPSDRFPCLSYAPFAGDQTPFDESLVIPPEQIERDLKLLAERTPCVRTYSVQHGLDAVVPIAERLGMRVMLGAWIGWDAEKNRRELEQAVALMRRHPDAVAALIVGNEVLLRQEQPADRLIALIKEARAAAPASIPVTYADVWEFWLRNPQVAQAVDFVTVHTLPYWEDDPVSILAAVSHVLAIVHRVTEAFPGKRIFIGEVGWPSTGRMREGALPSPVNQARFVRELMRATDAEDLGLNLIESFDQPWKRRLEGTVGGEWGLYTEDRQAKFPLQGPVSDDPRWLAHFAVSALLGLALIAPTLRRRPRLSIGGWLGLAAGGQLAGAMLVAGGLSALAASIGVLDALAWGGRWLLAAAAAALSLAAIVRPSGARPALPCSIFQLLTWWRQGRRPGRIAPGIALGAIRAGVLFGAAATTLCFLFDARYRDFPVALTALPALAFLAVAWAERRHAAVTVRADDRREERLLAHFIAVGGVLIALSEAPWNYQAWGLMAANLTLAAAIWIEARGCSRELRAARNTAADVEHCTANAPSNSNSLLLRRASVSLVPANSANGRLVRRPHSKDRLSKNGRA